VPADNITLTGKRKKINVVRVTRTMAETKTMVDTQTMAGTQTTAKYKCHRHDRFCNMGIYSLVSTSRVSADNITLTDKRKKINLVRDTNHGEDTNHGGVRK